MRYDVIFAIQGARVNPLKLEIGVVKIMENPRLHQSLE